MKIQLISPFFKSDKGALAIFILIGYIAAFYLYYIDEGNYHFEGLKQPAEWIFLSVYALIFAGCSRIIYSFLKKSEQLPQFAKVVISAIGGLMMIPLIIIALAFFLQLLKVF